MLTSLTFNVDNVYMSLLRKLFAQSSWLTATSLLMLATLLGDLFGMAVDTGSITGVSAWLKPAKFAISTAIFSITIAWLYRFLTPSRTIFRLANIIAATLIVEVTVINIQAFRHTTSHFNITTPANAILFSMMGTAILILWLASIGVFLALCQQRFKDPAWGWALRLGVLITVIGSATGGLMLRTTPEQAARHRLHLRVAVNGGHTVGAEDGGPGLPGVGWSKEHGDLRIPHFLGLHGLQAIPLLAWITRRRCNRTALVLTAAASYAAILAILLTQALAGESINHPSVLTLTALGLWLMATAVAAALTQWKPGGVRLD